MPATPKQLAQIAIGTTIATAYTAPASPGYTILKEINICNTATAAIKCQVHVVPSGGTAGTGNAIIYDWSVDANSLFVNVYDMIIPAGATIQVLASAAGCTATISGVEVT